jgi:hypothetical protein
MNIREIFAELYSSGGSNGALTLLRKFWHGWGEPEIVSLSEKLDEPRHYSDGMLKLTHPEYLALAEHNRRITAKRPNALVSPLLIWVTGRGLFTATRRH